MEGTLLSKESTDYFIGLLDAQQLVYCLKLLGYLARSTLLIKNRYLGMMCLIDAREL